MGADMSWFRPRIRRLELLVTDLQQASASVAGFAFVQLGNVFGALAVLGTKDANNLEIITNNVARAIFDQLGNLIPPADAAGQIGTNAKRWNVVRAVTVTSGDIEMQSESGDAHWTLKEAPDAIYAVNHVTGGRWRLAMDPVAENDPSWPTSEFAKSRAPTHAKFAPTLEAAIDDADKHRVETIGAVQAALTNFDPISAQATLSDLIARRTTVIAALPEFDHRPDEEGQRRVDTLQSHFDAAGGQIDALQEAIEAHREAVAAAQLKEAQRAVQQAEEEAALAAAEQAVQSAISQVLETPSAKAPIETPVITEEPVIETDSETPADGA